MTRVRGERAGGRTAAARVHDMATRRRRTPGDDDPPGGPRAPRRVLEAPERSPDVPNFETPGGCCARALGGQVHYKVNRNVKPSG